MIRLAILGLLAVAGLAEDDPLPPVKVAEIAIAQRDYVLAKAQFEQKAQTLQRLTEEAVESCRKAGRLPYDGDRIACPKPEAKPSPEAK